MKLTAVLFSVFSIAFAASSALAQETRRHVRLVSVVTASGNQIVVLPSVRVAPVGRARLAARLAGAAFPLASVGEDPAKAAAGLGANEDPPTKDGVTEPLAPGQTVILGATGGTTRVSTGVDTVVVTAPALPR